MKISLDEFSYITWVFNNCKKEHEPPGCCKCSHWEGFCHFKHFLAAGLSEEDRKKVYGD